jgi:hypothetical protein
MTTSQNEENTVTTTTYYIILKGDIEIIKQHKNFGSAIALMNSDNQIKHIRTEYTFLLEEDDWGDEFYHLINEHNFDYVMFTVNDYSNYDYTDIFTRKIVDGNDEELDDDEYNNFSDYLFMPDEEIFECSLNELPENAEFFNEFEFEEEEDKSNSYCNTSVFYPQDLPKFFLPRMA